MADQTPLEQKRAQAKMYRGVAYDDRIDRFTAGIMVRGERRHLGSFLTAGEASIVYEQARANDPIERPRRGGTAMSIKRALIVFEETALRGIDRKLVPDQIFVAPDGQRFRLEGVQAKNKRSTYVWSSRCKICGLLFEQNSVLSLRSITGMTRTCEEHRGQLGKMEAHDWSDPVEWETAPRALAPSVVVPISAAPAHWHPRLKTFADKYVRENPRATIKDVEAAYDRKIAEDVAKNSMTPEEKARYARLMAEQEQPANARLEDMEILAVVPEETNNEDLI